MRQTLKSLAVFSASLLVILLLSTGCMVNIPGCGKKSTATVSNASPPGAPTNPDPNANANAAPGAAVPAVAPALEAERIAYTAMDGDDWALFDMATDGSDIQRLTAKGVNAWFPLWSPNGKKLAFLSDMNNGKVNLFVLDKGTKEARQLTFFDDLMPPREKPAQAPFTWSPRSDQMALIYKQQVMLVDLEKLSQVSLVQVDPNDEILAVDWAPRRDNRYVAYLVRQGARYHSLYLVNPRLHDQVRLANIRDTAGPICWSSDASSVAYLFGNHLSEVAYETQRVKPILQENTPEFGPILSYAPMDGNNNILFLAKKDASEDGYRVALVDKPTTADADTGSAKYLTEPGVEFATWSPDATKILYVVQGAIWVMDASGNNKKRISLAGAKTPAWAKK